MNTRLLQDAEALLLGIDLGLEDLFNHPYIGIHWLQKSRAELNNETALHHIEQAIRDVSELVNEARGIR